ncbi:hypothetical protein [Salisediminibacterium selenitireducens]|uniref:Uncharacterized protein n=1 Tax=Bacillus selenitireducens (strain ATCC 700615 / DSM 15326 / MLS10) TaxID=439292 RepID=D6XZZ3_BACIE|nr:hypothetical protein [Salisediminibacterium selenitireducens]ADI00495.1 hypothetical protein Bsel_3013 [[Bacillus] selenitireducens MLS10]
MQAWFGRKVLDKQELLELTEEARRTNYPTQSYVVEREEELDEGAFAAFERDFLADQSWVSPYDGGEDLYGRIRCVRVSCKTRPERYLVNSEGYDYPRSIAIEIDPE